MTAWYQGDLGWHGWIAMTLVLVGFWVLLLLAVLKLFRTTTEVKRDARPAGRGPGPEPIRILDDRRARGDLDRDEYPARDDMIRAAR